MTKILFQLAAEHLRFKEFLKTLYKANSSQGISQSTILPTKDNQVDFRQMERQRRFANELLELSKDFAPEIRARMSVNQELETLKIKEKENLLKDLVSKAKKQQEIEKAREKNGETGSALDKASLAEGLNFPLIEVLYTNKHKEHREKILRRRAAAASTYSQPLNRSLQTRLMNKSLQAMRESSLAGSQSIFRSDSIIEGLSKTGLFSSEFENEPSFMVHSVERIHWKPTRFPLIRKRIKMVDLRTPPEPAKLVINPFRFK